MGYGPDVSLGLVTNHSISLCTRGVTAEPVSGFITHTGSVAYDSEFISHTGGAGCSPAFTIHFAHGGSSAIQSGDCDISNGACGAQRGILSFREISNCIGRSSFAVHQIVNGWLVPTLVVLLLPRCTAVLRSHRGIPTGLDGESSQGLHVPRA